MELMDAIRDRRSIREYEDRPVPEDKLAKILEAARLSPSARNSQDRCFIVVSDRERRRELARSAEHQQHLAAAPVVIAAVGTNPEYHMPNGVPAYPVDLAIALDHITLVAVEEGLGTCWIGGFNQEIAKNALGVPNKNVIAALLTLGFPKAIPEAKPRKSLEQVVCHDRFRD
ncbi:MAG TPA: nitroreductase [Dehalococcoidia bacterium]|nr:nitroreductase [Dehalococcoidia bacterium]